MSAELTDSQVRKVAACVKTLLVAESKSVAEVRTVDSIEGITSLPAVRTEGGTHEIVRVPMSLVGSGTSSGEISRLDGEIKRIIGTSGTGTDIFSGATVHVGYIDENGQIVIP